MDDARLTNLITALRLLQDELRRAVEQEDGRTADRLLAQLAVLERRRNRLVHEMVSGDGQRADMTAPLRDQVITVLRLLGRPSSIRLVADVARARFGEAIPTARIASLRRDEERSWQRSPGARPAYIVPALSTDRFAPVRGLLTLSSWELESRIVGPASPRVDMLLVLARLADDLSREREASWATALESVVWRLAATVPEAIGAGEHLDPIAVLRAAHAELALLEPDDLGERRSAAERARVHLDDQAMLFGSRMRVVDGGLVSAGRSA